MTRVAVISDIHGNCVALDAAIADLRAQEVDEWICLGDAIQGGPQPRQVLERLADLGCPVIMGNADAFIVTREVEEGSAEASSPALVEIAEWTAAEIGQEGLDVVGAFVATHSRGPWLCFHGSPRSYNEVLLPETPVDELRDALGEHDAQLFCGGHTHLQWTTTFDQKTFFNPGSVGVAYNRHMEQETFYVYPNAEYAVVHIEDDGMRIEFCRVPFDVDALERAALESGRPYGEREGQLYRPRRQNNK